MKREDFFEVKKGQITIGHALTIHNKVPRLDCRRHSFSQRVVNSWNALKQCHVP